MCLPALSHISIILGVLNLGVLVATLAWIPTLVL